MPTGYHFTVTWHALDAAACRQCLGLNGYVWTDADIYQGTLWHPVWGDAWNLDLNLPLTHGGGGHNCRCWIDVRTTVVWSEIKSVEDLGIILDAPVSEVSEAEDLSQLEDLKDKLQEINEQADLLGDHSPSLRQDVRLLNLLMMQIQNFTGDKSLDKAFQTMHQFMALALRVQLTINALNAVMMAPTPFGLLYAGANIIASGFAAASFFGYDSSRGS